MISGIWYTELKKAGLLGSGAFPGSDRRRLSLMMRSSDFDSDERPARENEQGNNLLHKGSSEKLQNNLEGEIGKSYQLFEYWKENDF